MRRETEGKKSQAVKVYFISTLIAVVIIFVGAFFVIDNPAEARAKNLDNKILDKFYTIDNCVDQYYREKKMMPENINDIKADCDYFLDKTGFDESNNKAFEYHFKADKTYELCAQFHSSNLNDQADDRMMMYNVSGDVKSSLHNSGWQCLERKVYYVDPASEAPVK